MATWVARRRRPDPARSEEQDAGSEAAAAQGRYGGGVDGLGRPMMGSTGFFFFLFFL